MFIKWWQENKFPVVSFLFWRISLFIFLYLALKSVPLQENFLGGGRQNYLSNPYLWSWLNFDGEHYLSIAQNGYRPLQYFYFPAFPLAIGYISQFIGKNLSNIALVGVLISNMSFLVGLVGFWKLLRIDFSEKVSKLIIVTLLLFPTSYYFASFYTESLFFLLTIWSFYFARKSKWLASGTLGFVASLTRIVGINLFPSLLIEAFMGIRKKGNLKFSWIILVPLGLASYMIYLNKVTGDPLEFFHSVSIFGQQRSSSFILPPQVIYRYVFKILPNLNYAFFPHTYTTLLEFVVGVGFLILTLYSFMKLRLSYSVYFLLGYLFPVFSGSFSSMPRYVLILFPGFMLIGMLIERLPKILQLTIFGLLFTSLGITFSLFSRGFWVS